MHLKEIILITQNEYFKNSPKAVGQHVSLQWKKLSYTFQEFKSLKKYLKVYFKAHNKVCWREDGGKRASRSYRYP